MFWPLCRDKMAFHMFAFISKVADGLLYAVRVGGSTVHYDH
jgi:hypothetical protein